MKDEPGRTPVRASAPVARRQWLWMAAAGGVAALGGVGAALRYTGATRAAAEPVPGFWGLQWQSPEAQPVSMVAWRGRPLLLNFWASWCAPCVDELPLLQQFYAANAANGWQVLGLAVDRQEPVRTFLQQVPLSFPVALAGATGMDLARALGNVAGGLPFSVVIASDGQVAARRMGRVSAADLQAWAAVK